MIPRSGTVTTSSGLAVAGDRKSTGRQESAQWRSANETTASRTRAAEP